AGHRTEGYAASVRPFFRYQVDGNGDGPHLRSIIENHGGRIWATQNPDQGVTLAFVLPVVPAAGRDLLKPLARETCAILVPPGNAASFSSWKVPAHCPTGLARFNFRVIPIAYVPCQL